MMNVSVPHAKNSAPGRLSSLARATSLCALGTLVAVVLTTAIEAAWAAPSRASTDTAPAKQAPIVLAADSPPASPAKTPKGGPSQHDDGATHSNQAAPAAGDRDRSRASGLGRDPTAEGGSQKQTTGAGREQTSPEARTMGDAPAATGPKSNTR